MSDHVLCQVVDSPLSKRFDDALVDRHIDGVVLIRPLVGVVVSVTGSTFVLAIIFLHVDIGVRVVALQCVLGIRLKQAPTRRPAHVHVVLAPIFVSLHVGSVDSDDVSDLAHNGAVLEPIGIDDDDCELEVLVDLVALRVERPIDNFEGANPLTLATLHRVSCINYHSVDVELFILGRVESVVFNLINGASKKCKKVC